MNATLERLRWRLVEILDRRPGYCWADLVMWANGNGEPAPRRSVRSCQEDAARKGSCWCGKVRDEEAAQRWYGQDCIWGLDGEPVHVDGGDQ